MKVVNSVQHVIWQTVKSGNFFLYATLSSDNVDLEGEKSICNISMFERVKFDFETFWKYSF